MYNKVPSKMSDDDAPWSYTVSHEIKGCERFLCIKDTKTRLNRQNVKTKIRRKPFKFTTFVRFKVIGYWYELLFRQWY